jgi:ribosomal protein S18 acetylase RimI-like enzyme
MYNLTIRPAIPSDGLQLRSAVIELQEYESRLHSTRLPGEQIADAYLKWMQQQAVEGGAVLVAEIEGEFVGFVSGWIEQERNIAESLDSNRFGYVSDICVLPAYRGRRIARQLLHALEIHLSRADVRRIRIVSLAANGSARASYESAGFAPYEVVYEKIIPGPSASRSK